jgi:putative phosphoesterase
MRIALVSDQHRNDVAFRAVMADLEGVGVDQIVCLGDVAQGGPQPVQVLHRLSSLGCETIIGNADAFVLGADVLEQPTPEQLEVRDWTRAQLDEGRVEQIRSFRPTVTVEAAGCSVLCFHGSSRSYDDVLLPEGEESDVERWRAQADVLAGGHTHRQWTRTIGDALFVNPGSVGLVYDHYRMDDEQPFRPLAEYAIVYADESGPAVDFRRVPYSLDELREAVLESGRPHASELVGQYRPLPA